MTLYKKEGRRYIPVHDTEAYNGLDNGSWLVHVENGCTSIRQSKNPAHAALEFATLIAKNKICNFLVKVSEARPKSKLYTKKQKKIIDEIQLLPDKDKFLLWEYDSYSEMAEKIIDLILENYKNNKND